MLQRSKSIDIENNNFAEPSQLSTTKLSKMDKLFTDKYGPPKSDLNDIPKRVSMVQFQDRVMFQGNSNQEDFLPNVSTPLEYWKKKKIEDPLLYELANTVLALPCCQVTVERLFSALKLILTYLRTRIGKDILNDIMILKGNSKLIDELEIDFSQIS